jgi:biotin carboxylase
MARVLLFATTTGYQTRMFGEAADRLGVELVYATDRCDKFDDPWADGAIAVRYHDDRSSLDAVVQATAASPVDGVLAVGDRPTVLAAEAARELGLPWHSPDAASSARDKCATRQLWREAGLPVPRSQAVTIQADPVPLSHALEYPVVVKPTILSGSRGVMRANNPEEFLAAFDRLRRLLDSTDVRQLRDPEAAVVQIEEYIDGREYAVEALLDRGALQVLTLFDKPDPLDGPYFEETIYVTPSRAPLELQEAIEAATRRAAIALGLSHGPIHAECRVREGIVYVLEIAARPIGGLCARALRFCNDGADPIGLEELLLRHALGEDIRSWTREPAASGVMMVPIPRAGILRAVDGIVEARSVPGVDDVRITAKMGQRLVPLPEGASYLGFIFAHGATPEQAERTLREAHASLRFVIDAELPLVRR